jgi:hypothetical protein
VSIGNATKAENAMRKRFALMSAFAAVTVLPAFAAPAEHPAPAAARSGDVRLAQLRRPDETRDPGGLPGAKPSDVSEESGHVRERSIVPRGKPKPAKTEKGKAKSGEGDKKDER